MSQVDELVTALDQDNFDSVLEGFMGPLDKDGLLKLVEQMNAKVGSIPDQDRRHLFKNGPVQKRPCSKTAWRRCR
ncbi:MAG: hypothetical protein IID61_06040 [SAR324 cluster bacterium]|nr:hypothetical protein [SAR324 cluster bacterium]